MACKSEAEFLLLLTAIIHFFQETKNIRLLDVEKDDSKLVELYADFWGAIYESLIY